MFWNRMQRVDNLNKKNKHLINKWMKIYLVRSWLNEKNKKVCSKNDKIKYEINFVIETDEGRG